jgi:hypothetical protein
MTDLSTDVQEELEAMQAIYCFDMQMRPAVWNYPCFAITVRSSGINEGSEINATVKFTLSASYPRTGPKFEVENCNGLSIDEKKGLNMVIEDTIKKNVNNVLIYEVISAVQNYIDNDVEVFQKESYYDAMIRKEQEKKAFVEGLKKNSQAEAPQPSSLPLLPTSAAGIAVGNGGLVATASKSAIGISTAMSTLDIHNEGCPTTKSPHHQRQIDWERWFQ